MKEMKPVLVFMYVIFFLFQNTYAQDLDKVIINIDLKNATLEEAITRIESLTNLKFSYKTADVAGVKNIWYQQQHVSVKKILTDITAGTALQFEQINNYILLKKDKSKSRQSTIVHGIVNAQNAGESLTGAMLDSITVEAIAGKGIFQKINTGLHRLNITDLKKIPMAGGEPDVLKSLQFLPGIQAAAEGTTNLSVRGGSYDQNLFLLDEAPVYNPTHMLGFFSVFNTDILKDISIYKGIFPAWYGSRLSSVIDIRTKDGNSKEPMLTGGIGLIASRLTYEAPIVKGKSSFMLSGRYSDLGALLNLSRVSNLVKFLVTNSRVAFYDLNAKFNTTLGSKDRLYISAYTGHDRFFLNLIDNSSLMKWGNSTVSGRWNHVFNQSLLANTSLLFSNYNYSYTIQDDSRNFIWKANLKEITLKTDFDWTVNDNNQLKFGAGITFQNALPGKVEPLTANAASKEVSLQNRKAAQVFAYAGYEQKVSKSIGLSWGLRVTGFVDLGEALVFKYAPNTSEATDSTLYPKGKIFQSYLCTEPRLTARFFLSPTVALKISAGRNYQFQHLLTSSTIGLPTDIWLPSDSYFKPQYADQFAAGVYKTIANEMYETSLEGYYRQSYNIIDFKDNADLFLNNKIETQVLTGRGKGYGLELLLKKNKGKGKGWISYTWSKALRQINGINNGMWYPPAYDHRHNLSLVYNYTINTRWSVAANWVYRSGGHTTMPVGSYIFNGYRFLYYGNRNSYTLPAYHRFDVTVTWQEKPRPARKWQGEWALSVYNVYNRQNVFAMYTSQDPYNYAYTKAWKVYLTGILPTVTYNFKF